MRWRELLDTYAAAVDRLFGPLTNDPLPSPERAKPETPQVKPITTVGGSQEWKARMLAARREALANRIDQGIADALADATETITNPYAQETPVTTPDPAAVALADAAPDNAFRTEDGGVLVRLAAGWLRIKDGYHRVLPLSAVVPGFGIGRNAVPLVPEVYTPKWETYVVDAARAVAAGAPARSVDTAGPDPSTPPRRVVIMREDEVGSAAWLRDLADRLHLYLITRFEIPADTARVSVGSPDSIRDHANEIERREHRAARDTRDRDRVTAMLREQVTYAYSSTTDTVTPGTPFTDLPPKLQDAMVDDALELYRAGRDDQEADVRNFVRSYWEQGAADASKATAEQLLGEEADRA
ncbi:hypothetical protein FK268_12730 [Tsukamurella sputi]|uniref:Uncharacterized protein n=1 Tax=Tsukamurella sputi TaxID=2591848 RepID=A0A5C5RJJ6_9ACTN|nr:hypothetical protein [Tsukamurella sputi]TWS23179.1 hypothetical protein FK268_12730 [Tsukamurella sputi]